MKKLVIFIIIVVIVIFASTEFGIRYNFKIKQHSQNIGLHDKINIQKPEEKRKTNTMKITGSAFENNSKIPTKYTCDGENINPPLEFVDVPSSAKSLVLIVDDPDAPSKTWVHWVVYNISPQSSEVKENSVPQDGVEGMTDFGKPGYGGPCPPSGTHRYFFKLYALHTALDLPQNATKQMVEEKMQGDIIDQAELIGLYSRQ